MKLRAYAKLNLSLRIFEKRPDGFHDLESIMQSISLYDSITLSPLSSGIEVICSDPAVPKGQDNIACKAAELFFRQKTKDQRQQTGIKIHIEKRIPMAAGLAGGSADAAAVLYGLNQMENAEFRMPNDELMKIGSEIGSDVPFCLVGGTCLVKGRGEIVEKQEPWPKTYFVLVTPNIHVSTKWAYEEIDRLHLNLPEDIKNDLEPVVVSKHDVITEIKEKLVKLGCNEAQMSGSGPSVFGIVRDKARGEKILSAMKEDHSRAYLVETIDKGVEHC
ncbi:MAG: 4-(cytidine 5'-diphospho)-2-C-methyl-D-erythritol kinase [Candidatus Margulisiibacteriota bacterium]|nr:4-(cytidine 5'-diphospho)-2-C-methyl-D-erythritol kinase [Candidatus Margulisiibacteriota bacterium]